MRDAYSPRTLAALALAAFVAAMIWLVGGAGQGAAVALVGAVAAVLLADRSGERPLVVSEPAAGADDAPPIGAVLEGLAAPVLLVHRNHVTIANGAARRLLGRHIIGEDIRVAIRHPAAAERLAGGTDDRGPVELVGLGAVDQHWEMGVSPVGDGSRLVQLADRTAAHAAERMRVDFVANASHELRTPLASILGYVETLGEEAGGDPAVRTRFLGIIDGEARRMQRLVEDLISLSRIEADKYRLPDRTVTLDALVAEVRAELAAAPGGRGGEVETRVEAGLPPVTGDRAQLSQMLHNLIGNAMKYGRAGTPVTVTLGLEPRGMVRLVVADRGDGIAPEHLPRLTERFYRADAGRSRAMGGTGLGLAIVKHVVERHRGRLDIASRVGEGTTVTVLLPPAGTAVIKP